MSSSPLVVTPKIGREVKFSRGRKSLVEFDMRDNGGQLIALAKKLRRKTPKGGRRSLRAIALGCTERAT